MADQAMIDLQAASFEDLNNIAQWIADNKFPGYSERVEEISLPNWMLPKEDGTLLIINPSTFIDGWPAHIGALGPKTLLLQQRPVL